MVAGRKSASAVSGQACTPDGVWQKYSNVLSNQKPAMMDGSHEGQSMGSSAGVCHGACKPGTVAAERVPRGGEPNSPRTPADTAAPVGFGTSHACRHRQT